MRKYLIITAEIDVKILNKLILTLRDWEFGEDDTWDDCTILQTVEDLRTGKMDIERPPVQKMPKIDFCGDSLEAIEDLLLSQGEKDCHLFLILDQQGVEEETIMVAERAIDIREEVQSLIYLDLYNKVRVPWAEAHVMWCNLEIGNMGFHEYVEEDEVVEGGMYTYQLSFKPDEKVIEKRDAMLRELAKLDLA